mmetsp:Transcript_28362/g.42783  ORF Transcript_28362/g.42783 Transcript_28362/m.42783 type:complete len:248 (+) Transcript_28362:2-745(+)
MVTMMNSRSVQRRRRPSPLFAVGLILCLLSSSHYECRTVAFAFSTSNPKTVQTLPDPATSSSSRRRVIAAITSTIITASTATLAPQSACADVTNKIASTTALRSLLNLKTQLPIRLKPVAQSNNYVGIKQCLREPPLDGIRKNMLVLVRGGEDGPKAGELLLAYKQLISALENMDATATLGMQGRNKKLNDDPFLLSLQYDEVEKALGLFIEVGSAAASIPLQEDDGKQTKVGSIDVRSGEVTPRYI